LHSQPTRCSLSLVCARGRQQRVLRCAAAACADAGSAVHPPCPLEQLLGCPAAALHLLLIRAARGSREPRARGTTPRRTRLGRMQAARVRAAPSPGGGAGTVKARPGTASGGRASQPPGIVPFSLRTFSCVTRVCREQSLTTTNGLHKTRPDSVPSVEYLRPRTRGPPAQSSGVDVHCTVATQRATASTNAS
jgi:hypothetical protein